MNTESKITQHSFLVSVILHLLPGILITLLYFILAPIVRAFDFPSLFAILLAILFVLIPFQIGVLFHESKKLNNNYSLKHIVLYRQPIAKHQFIILVIALFLWSGISLFMHALTEQFFIESFFSWVPDWFFLAEDFSAFPRKNVLLTLFAAFVLNAFIGPIVEEFYFRGYLLPRMRRFGIWAPAIHTTLFSLYHFFTPWQNLGRIVGLLPLIYVVQWKKNLYISMAVHVLGNLFSMIVLLMTYL